VPRTHAIEELDEAPAGVQLLTRLDKAIDKAWAEDVCTEEINTDLLLAPPKTARGFALKTALFRCLRRDVAHMCTD
jgi:hypothetical protein